jgi:quinol-cytochrome oxidoreductase complex cytochrome b subunit
MLRDPDRLIKSRPATSVGEWIDYRLPIFTFLRRELHEYPTPRNPTYLWNFGSLAGIVLVIMIVTGIVLAMHYTPTAADAFKAPRELLWRLGVIILLLMMATAFFGYTLPWCQMSFRGATVITNLFSAIPVVGDSIVTWLWGGYAVGNPTLQRFYALRVGASYYFLHFLVILPLLSWFERPSPLPASISTPALGGRTG